MIFTVSDTWRRAYPGTVVGVLALRDVSNPELHPLLEQMKEQLEKALRDQYSSFERSRLETIPPFPAYITYYKRFKKTYHVFLQLESIVSKGKSIPGGSALVEAMFMAELKDMLLTAGHDLDAVKPPVYLEIAQGNEHYTVFKGNDQVLKSGDMYITDAEGIISNVIYGPDSRTQINPNTKNVLFTTYAPPGVGKDNVQAHQNHILEYVKVFSPGVKIDLLDVMTSF
jgi:DNA/RNA-binding domain of Phe-tRNA-synthetase-like protein